MTNEELIEEILIKSHSLGIRNEVLERASEIMSSEPKYKTNRVDAIERAFLELKK